MGPVGPVPSNFGRRRDQVLLVPPNTAKFSSNFYFILPKMFNVMMFDLILV